MNKDNKDEYLLIGKIVGVHGIKGGIKILPYGDCEKKPWKQIQLSGNGRKLTCEVINNRPNKDVIIASIKGYTDRNSACELVGYNVFIEKASLPQLPDGEYYNFQLEGIEVVTEKGNIIGIVTSIFPTGSNDVYVVKNNDGEILIPASQDVVLDINVKARKITVRLSEGLHEIGTADEDIKGSIGDNEV